MIAEVLCVPHGGSAEIVRIDVAEDDLENLNELPDEWAELAIQIGAHKDQAGWSEELAIFICLDDEFVALFERRRLRLLLQVAREHALGIPVYLVISSGLENRPEVERDNGRVRDWFRIAVQEGVTEIIQSRLPETMSTAAWLIEESERVQARHRKLQMLLHHKEAEAWRCCFLLPAQGKRKPFSVLPTAVPGEAAHRVLVWSMNTASHRHQFDTELQFMLEANTGKHILATLATDLPEVQMQKAMDANLPVLHFAGFWELCFALNYLNDHHPPRDYSPKARQSEIWSAQEIFKPYNPYLRPSLLITNAFHPDDSWHYLEARKDVGQIIKVSPRNTRRYSHQAVKPERLKDMLSAHEGRDDAAHLLQLTVWLHLGHGDGERGLQEYTGGYFPADEWVSCLSGREASLALAFFSSCRSAKVAEAFVRAGVRVAIGFEGPVTPASCRDLATAVISAALWSHGNRDAILHAFHLACQKLSAEVLRTASPQVFHTP